MVADIVIMIQMTSETGHLSLYQNYSMTDVVDDGERKLHTDL